MRTQRWGVIAPEGPEGDRLISLIDPLIQARKAGQAGAEVKIYRAPPKMDMADASRWKKEVFDNGQDLAIDVPRYQLILGDLHQVPLAIQQVQSSDSYVGRLAFSNDSGYEGYVDKVLRWEKQRSAATQGSSLLFTVHDGTGATTSGYQSLITPGLEVA